MTTQLPLGISWRDQASFANFYCGENQQLIDSLLALNEPLVFIWGENGAGKSHLLQAVCQHASQHSQPVYLPMQELMALQPAVFEGMENMEPLCLDDVQLLAGNREWEEALFHLFNRVRDRGGKMIVTATSPPNQLAIQLPDLVTRLAWGTVYQLHPLDDEGKRIALQQRASQRGLELPDEVVDFVLKRSVRDMNSLFALLDTLDVASLATQRRLTIPFVKQYLG